MRAKKIWIFVIITGVLTLASIFIWNKLTYVDQPLVDIKNYRSELDSIRNLRRSLHKQNAGLKTVKKAFIKNINERIFKYWYGTEWDFNGTSEKPREGNIACGYFVTTTLRDMGIPINRVKMAQCASEEMIRSLTEKKNIYHLSNLSLTDLEKKLEAKGEGLYIIGLDNHTGFVLISEEGNFFIHSSGWFPFKVVKQKLGESDVIGRSKYRVVGRISDDEAFLEKWINSPI